MSNNSITIVVEGRKIRTLCDILPSEPGLQMLFVAKTPAPKSVAAGHYFQGRQGRMFWNKLIQYDVLRPTTRFEDDSLLSHGFGITDIVKVPHDFGREPSNEEYASGIVRTLELVKIHQPKIVVFVYMRVLDKILKLHFNIHEKSAYGFNPKFEGRFGTRVFVFPMPGTPCASEEAEIAMRALRQTLDQAG